MNEYVDRVRRDERGFTLIELLIVIVILGVLAGIVIFAVGGITDKGNLAACRSDLKTVSVAVEAFYAQNGGYPEDLQPSLTGEVGESPVFLRPQSGLAGVTLTQLKGGYVITYDPDTGEVTSNMTDC